ncbi:OmpH family outer membrane protein [Erythrobacter sp. CCH5-A1]|jgi:Skp family chaperone for outer membrane proteins|uniref:OmpH family outer membrane protein n=1 Tax=Erythrobacter sp. CCH5-A1 TaxID=1768792 RepID=UPI0008325CE1|nr:OmpH family outer membrane protein [Erythrobacter sp. CCH5-A1]
MTRFTKLIAPAGLILAAAAALPASAQVQGNIATVDVPRAIIETTALRTAYEQVNTTYAQQNELRRTKAQERQTLLVKFDKNGDKQVDDAEQTAMQKSPDFAKIQTLEQEITALNNQIDGARVFAVEQIIMQYPSALQDVTTKDQIKIVIDPGSLLFAPPEADVTAKVTAALNVRVPAVGVVPPSGWQPTREGVQVYQQIQQVLVAATIAQQQQAAAAAQQPGNPAAPVGR